VKVKVEERRRRSKGKEEEVKVKVARFGRNRRRVGEDFSQSEAFWLFFGLETWVIGQKSSAFPNEPVGCARCVSSRCSCGSWDVCVWGGGIRWTFGSSQLHRGFDWGTEDG